MRGVVHRAPIVVDPARGWRRSGSWRVLSGGQAGKELPPMDGYLERLAKYIPAEVTSAYVGLALLASLKGWGWVLGVSILCLVAVPVYVFLRDNRDPEADRTRPHFYVLAALAFPCWAAAVSEPFRTLTHIDTVLAGLLVALSAFVFPLVDLLVDTFFPRRAPQAAANGGALSK
jgi:hypothetical protein